MKWRHEVDLVSVNSDPAKTKMNTSEGLACGEITFADEPPAVVFYPSQHTPLGR